MASSTNCTVENLPHGINDILLDGFNKLYYLRHVNGGINDLLLDGFNKLYYLRHVNGRI